MCDVTRTCEYCGVSFTRTGDEARWRFKMRRYCSHGCYSLAKAARGAVVARVKEVLAYDPDLETWQIMERFGVGETAAENWRRRFRVSA